MDEETDLTPEFMADGFVLRVFMLSVCMELAKSHDDPAAWGHSFIEEMTARLDTHEASSDNASVVDIYELARDRIDGFGLTLMDILRSQKT